MENQRIRLTKKLLSDALLDLLSKKNIERISIQQLSIAAGVNRSTFYLHYQDIYHLLKEIEDKLISDIKDYLKLNDDDKTSNIVKLLEYIGSHREVFKVLLIHCDSSTFNDSFLKISSEILENELELAFPNKYKSYIIEYLLKANNALIFKWIYNDFDLTVIELSTIMTSLSRNVVNAPVSL